MNIDEALIERIIREVVSQVVAEKAAGSGQNRSASGDNQSSMQSVNLGQIEQLVKNVASGDRQTSSGGQTSNAGGYHPEEPVHDVDIEEDITSREVKKRPLIDQPQDPEALERMMRLTTARIGVGCAGPRLKTQTLLTLRADHARARDAVMLDVHQDVIDNLKLFSVQTRCQDKNEFLTRPDLGRRLSEDGVQKVKDQCIEGPDVQLIVADGLSSTAINANIENVLPVLMDGLSAAGLRVGTPFFVRYGRVAVEDEIAELVMKDNPYWEGSPTALVALINMDIQPHVITRKLNVLAGRLYTEHGILFRSERVHEGRKLRFWKDNTENA